MKAIEFETKAKKGNLIEIPEEYLGEISGPFRVILLLNKEEIEKNKKPKRKFTSLNLKTKGVKFNREEIYDE